MEWRKRRPKSRPASGRAHRDSRSAKALPPALRNPRIRIVRIKDWESMKPPQARIADLWCRLMHTEPMWPLHGQYECRTCGRRYRVCWEEPSRATPRVNARPCETRAQGALVAATESTIQCQ